LCKTNFDRLANISYPLSSFYMPEEKGRFDVGVVNNYELDSCMF
jgi:hypothetical protein